jgi:hypothetical protein
MYQNTFTCRYFQVGMKRVFVCMYVCMNVFIYLFTKHAPSLGSNTTCSNATSGNYWIFVGVAGRASALDAGRCIPCKTYHHFMVNPSSLWLHCLSYSLSNYIEFVNFKMISNVWLLGHVCLEASFHDLVFPS